MCIRINGISPGQRITGLHFAAYPGLSDQATLICLALRFSGASHPTGWLIHDQHACVVSQGNIPRVIAMPVQLD